MSRVVGPRLLTIQQVAELLNVPERWVRDKVTQRAIPFTRIGKHVRFTREHLKEIIRQGEQEVIVIETNTGRLGRRRRVPRYQRDVNTADFLPLHRQPPARGVQRDQ